ncbi:MAG TPA: type IV toxin-antitoxin system AbiEi family antitoxin [Pseudomonas sp.]|uniref:type IV toxin-antitoxin system AbiEi family antitoxin n=1 Tax=Pseudomonas sp. TaxID=306 RepID=UPI002B46DC20|nr:type IV toxin-antitoxin system AbiEi family antitoxin [Pseudomonas sp.]HKS14915.1 type IV toxin-antitoxin system AbiEi family antitoxin [Pseudomonas sp.]
MNRQRNWVMEPEQQVLDEIAASLVEAIGPDAQVSLDAEHLSRVSKTSRLSEVVDGMLRVTTPDKSLDVYIKVIANGYPRDIREAVSRLDLCLVAHGSAGNAIGMVAARTLSPGAKHALKALGVAFYEVGGSLYLQHGHWRINIEKLTRAAGKDRALDLFTEARENVVHALLSHEGEWLSGAQLAQLAHTSPYTCSLVLQELKLREWTAEAGGGPTKRRKLAQPRQLLDAWATDWQGRKSPETKWHTFVENPAQLISHLAGQLAEHSVDFPWAFTGAAAANAVAPLLTSTQGAEIIVPAGYMEVMAKLLNLKPVTKGGNVTLMERQEASLLFRHQPTGQSGYIASPYILYLDLLNGRGRNKELAEHIRNHLELSWARN